VRGNESGSQPAAELDMRTFVLFLIIAILGGLFLYQKRSEQISTPKTEAPSAAATPRRTYEHDWAKHSLDTTHSVIDKIQQQRKEDDLKDAVGRR
jgi:hypothetical protein